MDDQCYNLRIGTRIKQNWVPRRRTGRKRRQSESDNDSEENTEQETPSRLVQSLIDPILSPSQRQLYFSPIRRRQIASESSSEASSSGKNSPVKKIRQEKNDSAETITQPIDEQLGQQCDLLELEAEYLAKIAAEKQFLEKQTINRQIG